MVWILKQGCDYQPLPPPLFPSAMTEATLRSEIKRLKRFAKTALSSVTRTTAEKAIAEYEAELDRRAISAVENALLTINQKPMREKP